MIVKSIDAVVRVILDRRPSIEDACCWRMFLFVSWLTLAANTSVPAAHGEAMPAASVTETSQPIGRQALRSLGKVPWYSGDEDRIKAVPVESTDASDADVAARTSGYVGIDNGKSTTPQNFDSILEMIGQVIAWSLLAVVLLLIFAAIGYAFILHERDRARRRGAAGNHREDPSETAERLERLPVRIDHPASNLLGEARRLMELGRYNEAIIYLFSHELVQLDRHQLLRLARGKTNRQYLREIRQSNALQAILHDTIHAFEDAFFGDHTLTRQRFQRCWEQLDNFHAAIDQTGNKGASA
ncbi:hypothetical protein Poly24_40230 [Rosistilla carotiformis]|uniref:Protein-glutamine gamma-glutamyltransferase-like C-terminal domain-containing protein n=1 Tax=Rosistilla carotiformis TaxID=2528017 RepID=A0A518JXN8_9BACT|nr:DUF4129 domain-containing protein [Rosistilla carotiformis]QDV70303.1 hypothetical protein Poly24_40230 [Rosistilla carotiformis]